MKIVQIKLVLENCLYFSNTTYYFKMLDRLIKFDCTAQESFFLWGPRQSGKSTLLRKRFPDALTINLLESDTFAKYTANPARLRQELRALNHCPGRIIIDEVQKIPALLDEVHLLIEEDQISFGLCGSSARKLKRGHANMLVNFTTIARDVGVSSQTVKDHFGILTDTLIGHWLPAFTARPKRRIAAAPKFYFDDVGVVNVLAKRLHIEPGSASFGRAFENWVFHELWAWNRYRRPLSELSYWRLSSGIEVDFVIDDMQVAIEAKATKNIHSDHLKGLRELRKDHPDCQKLIVISLETVRRQTEDGILILPAAEFVADLWAGTLLGNFV